MERAQTQMPQLSLDPKRIAATSVAISVHVLVLMLLMLPAQTAPSKADVEDPPMSIVPTYIRPIPIVQIAPRPRPVPVERQPVVQLTPPVEPADDTVAPIDPYVPPIDTSDIVQPFNPPPETPAFAQIRADISPPPPYPAQALKRQQQGVVTLRVLVGAGGKPVSAVIENSSGSRLLDLAALNFVLARWHFIPATRDGVPIEAYALVPIDFVIEQ